MGCITDPREGDMQNGVTDDRTVQGPANSASSNAQNPSSTRDVRMSPHTSQGSSTTPPGTTSSPGNSSLHTGLPHISSVPNLHGDRPHSVPDHHRQFGHILRIMGDSYCYSCGIALRQMGDELSAEYEVRRALSTGDLPSSMRNSR